MTEPNLKIVEKPEPLKKWFPQSIASPVFVAKWEEWEEHLKESGKPITQAGRRANLFRCEREGEARSLDVIELCIEKGWKSLVWDYSPPKSDWRQDNEIRAKEL